MRFAPAFAIVCLCGVMGCTNTPWSSFMREPGGEATPAAGSGTNPGAGSAAQTDQVNSADASTAIQDLPPGGATTNNTATGMSPLGANFGTPHSSQQGISQTLNQLVLEGKLTPQERREFEVSLAQIEQPMLKQQVIAMIHAAGGTPAAEPPMPEFNPRMQDPASGVGAANSTISDMGPYYAQQPPAVARRDPQSARTSEPAPFPASQELIQRLQANTSQSGAYSRRNDAYDRPYDPREKPNSHANYLEEIEDRDRRPRGRENELGSAWQQSLNETITLLERRTIEVPRSDEEVSEHAFLRMMYLMAGRKEDALRPIRGIPTVSQDFWIEEMYGLSEFLDHEEFPTPSRRAAAAMERFAKAHKRLGELANINIKRAAFCREVKSYGVITRFPKDVFRPQETVLLYAEIENFRSTPGPEGYRTELRGSYVIQSENQQRVAPEVVLAPIADLCENERKDFFLNYFVTLPQQIYPGKYHLILTIEDTQAQRFTSTTIDFEIGETSGGDY